MAGATITAGRESHPAPKVATHTVPGSSGEVKARPRSRWCQGRRQRSIGYDPSGSPRSPEVPDGPVAGASVARRVGRYARIRATHVKQSPTRRDDPGGLACITITRAAGRSWRAPVGSQSEGTRKGCPDEIVCMHVGAIPAVARGIAASIVVTKHPAGAGGTAARRTHTPVGNHRRWRACSRCIGRWRSGCDRSAHHLSIICAND